MKIRFASKFSKDLRKISEEDHKCIAHLTEFGPYAHTHGETYNIAQQNTLEVLDLLDDQLN